MAKATLIKHKWLHLYLDYNPVRGNGCIHLVRANWPKLTTLDLSIEYKMQIAARYQMRAACTYQNQSGLNWSLLIYVDIGIFLENNDIGNVGCFYISKADWPELNTFIICSAYKYLEINSIGVVGCEHLSKTRWLKL
jgi:hypothetical protein